MIIEIIPFDISIDNEGFSYFIKDELVDQISIWSIVEIPVKNNVIYWVVGKMNVEYSEQNIKSIVGIACSMPILDEYQIKTIYDLSSRYFVNIHKILNLFLPQYIFKSLENKSFVDLELIETGEKIKNEKLLIFNKSNEINSIILDLLEKWENIVLIFPDDYMIDDFLEKNKKLEEQAIIYRNKFSSNKKYKTFVNIFNRTKKIIIWTRKVLLYNLKAYEKIIYIEDSFIKYIYSYEHKYKNTDFLKYIWKNWNFDINIVSTIPLVESVYKVIKKEYKIINI
ncbi:MAG: hypothetical protein ACD_49C00016G0003 [uncultured bacterium (gcode 4)]|uniref:Primosomal protein N' 3' DNA-binding domain-containing protein n=1 Tax=uncultured bacterium (gcode 4) TaxID=1234023 RepID=K2AFH3_9BACT|nr:MAG: hypothetical protein ACD_49C00016G0003 [uncultured bacterium (gcode 4)]